MENRDEAIRSPRWFVNRPIAMRVCVCVCVRALQKVAAKIASSPLERHLVRRIGTRSSGRDEGKKLLFPRADQKEAKVFLERPLRREARLEHSSAIRARDGSTATDY